jgi:hypothetical protein
MKDRAHPFQNVAPREAIFSNTEIQPQQEFLVKLMGKKLQQWY